MQSGQWARVEATARDWLEIEPASEEAIAFLFWGLHFQGRSREAAKPLHRWLGMCPQAEEAHNAAAWHYISSNEPQKARKHARLAIEQAPEFATYWQALAWAEHGCRRKKQACEAIRKAREFQPNNPDIAADSIQLIGRDEPPPKVARQQITQLQEILAVDPENARVHNDIGRLQFDALRKPREAEASFREAARIEPRNRWYRNNLFLTIRSRDPIYAFLRLPLTVAATMSGLLTRWYFLLLCIFFIPVLLYLILVPLALYGLWFYPLQKTYEWMTMRDLEARAAGLGKRSISWRRFRAWPFLARFALFFSVWTLFWAGILALLRNVETIAGIPTMPAVIGAALLVSLCVAVVEALHRHHLNKQSGST